MKSRKNTLPIAPFSLRETGPIAQAKLTKKVGFFRFAHGTGADRRATLDPTPCPHCRGKVEWALTYRRERGDVVPYIYARCRNAPKSHRWDFTHWKPVEALRPRMAANRKERPSPPKVAPQPRPPATEIPAPRPSIGTNLMADWIEKRIGVLSAELDRLGKIRTLAAEVATMEGVKVPAPLITPHNGDHTKH